VLELSALGLDRQQLRAGYRRRRIPLRRRRAVRFTIAANARAKTVTAAAAPDENAIAAQLAHRRRRYAQKLRKLWAGHNFVVRYHLVQLSFLGDFKNLSQISIKRSGGPR
jgi:hypothetical protein